jgi:hypothetical protein
MALPPWLVNLLPPILMVALLPLLIRGADLLFGFGCDWKSVRERFPARDPQKPGDTYEGQSGGIIRGSARYSLRGLTVRVAPAGVYLHPSFARRCPCFIPWSGIRRAAVRGASISVTVESEQPFYFSLPGKALPVLEANLEPDKIQRLPSVSAVLVGLARGGVLRDAIGSRWMVAVGLFGTVCFMVLGTLPLSIGTALLISALAGALGTVGMYLVPSLLGGKSVSAGKSPAPGGRHQKRPAEESDDEQAGS